MTVSGEYYYMLKALKNMDERQLLELFHDLDDIDAVERIADCAFHFVETFEQEVTDIVRGNEKSDEQDWKEQDDAQRYRDIKSTQERSY